MRLHVDEYVQVPRGASVDAGVPFPGNAELAARSNARRNADGDMGVLPHAALSVADGTGVGNDFPGAVARGAGGLLDKKPALLGDDAAPLAGRTGLERFLAFPGSGAVAGLAGYQAFDFQLLGATAGRFLQRDIQIITQVGTGPFAGTLLAAAGAAPEHVRKASHSGEHLGEDIHRVLEPAASGIAAAPGSALFKGGVAEAVVGSSLVRIGKHFIGLPQLLELFLRGGVVRVAVRVVFQGQLAVGLFNLVICGAFGNAQDFVIIFFSHVA